MSKLLEFRAKNFRSIGDNQVLSLLPSTRHSEYPDNILSDGKWPALGAIAIYGAIPALGSFGDYMKQMIWQKEEK